MTDRFELKKIVLSTSTAFLLSACGGGGGGVNGTDSSQQLPRDLKGETLLISPNPDPSSQACSTLTECFNVTESWITPYKNFKQAAASYTFDDGTPSSPQIADIFEQRGYRATFYLNAGLVEETDWENWGVLAKKGHEIGNHSWTHALKLGEDTVTDEELDEQINRGYHFTHEKIGVYPSGFAFPWHSYNARALAAAYKNHFAVRLREHDMESSYQFAFFDTDISHYQGSNDAERGETALQRVNQQLRDAVENGGWFVAAGHGIDGDGWSPVTSQFLETHLDLADSFKSLLWVDTHLNVERYRQCRKMVDPKITIQSASQARIQLSGNYQAAFCTEPLTLAIPVLKKPHGKVSAFDEAGTEIPVTPEREKLLINIKPGQTISLKLAH